jgi:hypothetical protein
MSAECVSVCVFKGGGGGGVIRFNQVKTNLDPA